MVDTRQVSGRGIQEGYESHRTVNKPGPGASCCVDHQAFPAALTDKEGSRPLGSTVVLSHVGSGWHCNLPLMSEETEAPGG